MGDQTKELSCFPISEDHGRKGALKYLTMDISRLTIFHSQGGCTGKSVDIIGPSINEAIISAYLFSSAKQWADQIFVIF